MYFSYTKYLRSMRVYPRNLSTSLQSVFRPWNHSPITFERREKTTTAGLSFTGISETLFSFGAVQISIRIANFQEIESRRRNSSRSIFDRSEGLRMAKKQLSRKDLRKATRLLKKSKKVEHVAKKAKTGSSEVKNEKKAGPLSKILKEGKVRASSSSSSKSKLDQSEKKKRKKDSMDADAAYDPVIEAEEKELARLSKLLGIKDEKDAKTRSKLSREYEMYEGLGNDFGDFLMEMDNIGKRDIDSIPADYLQESDDDVEEVKEQGGLIADEDQEVEDIQLVDYEGGLSEEELSEEEPILTSEDEDEEEEEEEDVPISASDNDSEEEHSDKDSDSEDEVADSPKPMDASKSVYRPVKGEDIYGRAITPTASGQGGRYIPPALRAKMAANETSATSTSGKRENEDDEESADLRKQINGLMNRLSEQSRDHVVRQLKNMYSSHSRHITNQVLATNIVDACTSSSQLMTNLIPTYASVIAALHYAVGVEVGAHMVEMLVLRFYSIVHRNDDTDKDKGAHPLVSGKLANNCLLLVMYLYVYKVVHHQLILDLLVLLTDTYTNADASLAQPFTDSNGQGKKRSREEETDAQREVHRLTIEKVAELIVNVIETCGTSLRGDDPAKLRELIGVLGSKNEEYSEGTRTRFLIDSVLQYSNSKSKRGSDGTAEATKGVKKWLGTIKTSFGKSGVRNTLRVGLKDLLDAEERGRWWIQGAMWQGADSQGASSLTSQASNHVEEGEEEISQEEAKLLQIAEKMRLNTSIRKKVFVVMMSSRDLEDAFERLNRLALKGHQEREIVRVLIECCGQEKEYNAFYAELASLLCDHNRQFRTTLQFCFWDTFKKISSGNEDKRRIMNLARLLSHLVIGFHLPLSVLKTIDISTMQSSMQLFLSSLFMSLFHSDISEETYQSVFDRVATTKDFRAVKELVHIFLTKHFPKVYKAEESVSGKVLRKRCKRAVKIMNEIGDAFDVPI